MPLPKIIFFTDFDGTITPKEGGATVKSPFYQSLLLNYIPGNIQNYKLTPMKSSQEVQDLFKAEFGEYDPDKDYKSTNFLMGKEEVAFFYEALKNTNVKVYIVTKNRHEYIKAVFRFQGFSEDEINQLNILDAPISKYELVRQELHSYPLKKENIIYILDDNKLDFGEMVLAVKEKNLDVNAQINMHHASPGSFQWLMYLKEISSFSTQNNITGSNQNSINPIHFGKITAYDNKPGAYYLVFSNQEELSAALEQIERLGIQESSSQSLVDSQAFEYRKARQDFTLEITLNTINLILQAREAISVTSTTSNLPPPEQHLSVEKQRTTVPQTEKSIKYPYGKNNKSRLHAFTASAEGLSHDYKLYRGDVLKRQILKDFQKSLQGITTPNELEETIENFTKTKAFRTLKKSQGITTFLLKLKTDSLKEFESICQDARDSIKAPKQNL